MPEIEDLKSHLIQISEDDENAFRKIFHTFSTMVYSFAFRLTHSEYTAEEIVQEVFLKVWSHRRSLSGVENFPAYLSTITRNLTFNVLKHNLVAEKAIKTLQHRQADLHHQTEETVIYRDYEQLLNRAINLLPPQQKLVYSMCHQEGLRYDEVARKLKISRLTVKSHMQRALRTIKTQFAGALRISVLLLTFSW